MLRFTIGLLLLALAMPASAQTARDLSSVVDRTITVERALQDSLDNWTAERAALEGRYRAAKGHVAWLQQRIELEDKRAAALDTHVRDLDRRLSESTRLQAVIQDSMNAVLQRLERIVANDLPFLQDERQARLRALRAEIARPEVDSAEKLRRLLEGLLVEAQYGGTVEVSQEPILIDGSQKYVDMLRLGRLALFWRTPDGTQIGTWDPVTQSHVTMSDGHARSLKRAMEMATRMRPVQLLSLPLGRIEL